MVREKVGEGEDEGVADKVGVGVLEVVDEGVRE